ncbi:MULTISPECIES: hypothetical protein [Mesorhizobium]|uniref:Uncharacterized protein n=1 Tax=Mesorhizobium shonense TaxID=1209948 RepID=A0ABV2HJM0_9HYPH|nr:hypothetical protein [Mesorhizobium sp.]
MLAEDFGRGVALDLLGARIPTCDVAVGVEGVDRIVSNGVDEKLEAMAVGKMLRVGCGQWHCRTRVVR